VNLPFSFGVASMCADVERLPRRQFWVGEGLCSDDDTVTLTLFGEAALSGVRTQSPAATSSG
jgi:hypothetical protein